MKNIKSKSKFFLILNTLVLILFTSCGEKKTEETHEEEKSETEVALTEAQFKTIGIETGTIVMKNLNTVIKANGYTASTSEYGKYINLNWWCRKRYLCVRRHLCGKRENISNHPKP